MQLSIVIVNYKVKYYLEQCLLSVKAASGNLTVEVFVVDNASHDDSINYLRPGFPDVTFIENEENVGFSKANNQAISLCKGSYILLLNPDTVVGERTLERVVQFMDSHTDAGGVGVKMIDRTGKFLPESKRSLPTPWSSFCKLSGLASLFPKSPWFGKYRLLFLDENSMYQVDVLSGAFMCMRAEALAKTGLLDEAFFMYGEDIDLSYRILKAGYKNYYLPETIIHYKGESTKKDSLKYLTSFYGAMLIFYRKHYPKHSRFFSAVVRFVLFLHSIYAFLRYRLFFKINKSSAPDLLLIPNPGEKFESMIHRLVRNSKV